MVYVIVVFSVAAIYFIVYRFSKFFGMTNNTTILVDTAYESMKERRFKVPIRQLTTSGIRNVLHGWAIVAILIGCMLLALLAIFIFQQIGNV